MAPDWDADSPELRTNLQAAADAVIVHAQSGNLPDIDLPREWHRLALRGLSVPDPTFVGGYRGEFPSSWLKFYDVCVDVLPGAPCGLVNRQLRNFFVWLRGECTRLDQWRTKLPQGTVLTAAEDAELTAFDYEVLRVAAIAHGEWVRIHPFPNGNGRVARMWVLWVTSRYDLPVLMPLRPRPLYSGYGDASRASMIGDHRPMRALMGQLYAATV